MTITPSLPKLPNEVRSVQLCYEPGIKLSESDPSLGRNRYLVVNGTNLTTIESFGRMMKQCICIEES